MSFNIPLRYTSVKKKNMHHDMSYIKRGGRMVVGFTTTYVIGAYHH
jgi:hypothetical protein